MAKKNVSKISRLSNALQNGTTVTIPQAISRFGFASVNSVTRAICTLRERGLKISTITTRSGVTAYEV